MLTGALLEPRNRGGSGSFGLVRSWLLLDCFVFGGDTGAFRLTGAETEVI